MNEKIDYVIARKWPNGSLCCYAYGSQVFNGTIEEAQSMKEFINSRCDEEHEGEYKIYRIEKETIDMT